MRRIVTVLTVIALAAAGCLGGTGLDAQSTDGGPDAPSTDDGSDAAEPVLEALGFPPVQHHDHTNASEHTASANVDFVTWEPFLRDELGDVGFAGLRICEDWAILATDGEPGGFLVVDVTDPAAPELVGRYTTDAAATQEALPVSGCDYVLLNAQDPPSPSTMVERPERGTGLGIQIVDITDKADPTFVSFLPVQAYGTHNIQKKLIGGELHVFYTGQPLGLPVPGTNQVWTEPVGNSIGIARFVEEPDPHLEPVSQWRYEEGAVATTSEGSFPHDMRIVEHPETGQMLMYVAHWDGGVVTVDVTEPAAPRTLDAHADPAPSQVRSTHYVRQDPTLRDGRVVAWSGPEIGIVEGETGVVRAYDVTDPGDLQQIGTWELPGQLEIDAPYIFSPHNFAIRGDVMALGHYHAGLWFLDVSDPTNVTAVGHYQPHGEHDDPFEGEVWRKTPNFPEAYLPNVFGVRWVDGPGNETYLMSSERGTGLYVLQLDDALEPMLAGQPPEARPPTR